MLDGRDDLAQAEQLGVLVDLALEVGDEDEGQHGEQGDEGAQEDQQDRDALGGVGDGGDDGRVDQADDQAGSAVDGVAHADLGGVIVLRAAQADDLEARAPPDQDGGDAVADEHHVEHLDGRQHGVDEGQDSGGAETDPGQRAHAHLVGDDAGG